MSSRITKDEFNRLRNKKRKFNAMVSLVSSAALIAVLAICIIVFNDRPSDSEFSSNIHIGGNADLTTESMNNISHGTQTPSDAETGSETGEDIPQDASSTDVTFYQSESDNQEFVIPETSLPPVEEIKGNDWCASAYEKVNQVMPLSYFDKTVLIGDSRTEGLVLYSGLSNINGFCYKGLNVSSLDSDSCITIPGYGGQYTCYQAISMTSYDNYYCMFGINELGWYNLDAFTEDFSALIDYIKLANPSATIYVEGVIPVCRSKEAEGGVFTKSRVEEFNALILDMCKERNDVIFLDVGAAVRDEEGYLPEEGSPDGIHCNADYCKRVLQYIRCNTYTRKQKQNFDL
ncbi:MAG: GDSL-type esterase/lipase family protein [Clostridium sp.]|nr:GDSL-type esterase/lipase family protein [Clostridium sp.]MCM1209025.1 GDSL-type esterase/lipase family protein [Ruminococcus sp.]